MKNVNKSVMIERYIEEIGYRLPKAGRQDILDEIRSLILDTLDDRAEAHDGSDR